MNQFSRSSRSFARPRLRVPRSPAVLTLSAICLAVFIVQRVLTLREPALAHMLISTFGLSRPFLARGFFWQPVSYLFLHGSLLHLALNVLVIVLLGAGLEADLGTRRFWALFLLSGLLGGLGWLVLAGSGFAVCIGASGGVFGLIGAYAGLFPRRNITLLLFFVIPITLQAWVLALVLGLSTLFDMMLGAHAETAYAAHLAGGIAGYLYGRMLSRPRKRFRPFRANRQRSRVSQTDLDVLLDKISSRGLSSLTPAEQAALHRYARRGLEGGAGRRDGP